MDALDVIKLPYVYPPSIECSKCVHSARSAERDIERLAYEVTHIKTYASEPKSPRSAAPSGHVETQ